MYLVAVLTRFCVASSLVFGLLACSDPAEHPPDASGDVSADAAGIDAEVDVQVDAGPSGMRIATMNLRCLVEEWDQRVPLIIAELAALNPDVIALQEVCRQENGADALPDFLYRLSMATGETYESQRAETHLAWDTYHEGLALLTRHRFEHVEVVDLPVGVFPRKAVVGRIAGTIPLTVGVTHLSFGEQEEARMNQLGALREHMAQVRKPGSTVLIAGDLNEGPTGGAVRGATNSGYQDSWAMLHASNAGPTFPARAPESRIDYVLFSPPDDSLQVQQVERFLNTPTDGRFPSDHFGLWVDIGSP